jgi:hypothetical protein
MISTSVKFEDINKWEKAVVYALNLDGWDMTWTGEGYDHYDAKGKTPKGFDCVIEMKFRDKYYPDKMLEKYKADKLLSLGVVAIYFVADPKGNYFYWLNELQFPESVEKWCPSTTLWNNKKELKEVYLLPESDSVIKNKYNNNDK